MPFYTRSSTERRQRGSSHIAQRSASAATMVRVVGGPDPRYISTSCIERQNLTMRKSNMMYYNFRAQAPDAGQHPRPEPLPRRAAALLQRDVGRQTANGLI